MEIIEKKILVETTKEQSSVIKNRFSQHSKLKEFPENRNPNKIKGERKEKTLAPGSRSVSKHRSSEFQGQNQHGGEMSMDQGAISTLIH